MLIEVPRGWSPFSQKPKLSTECQVRSDSFQLSEGGDWHDTANALASLEHQGTEVAYNHERPTILVPVYYQGIGDWLRAVVSLKTVKSALNQRISLVCLDTPVARDMIATQLSAVISDVIWVPMKEPFYHGEAECSLDWYFCHSHLAWNILLAQLQEQFKDSVVLRNPNYKLPPYDEFRYDFRLGLLDSAQTEKYHVSEESRVFANKWFESHRIIPEKCFGIGFRTDRNLSSSHRMTNQDHINRVIAYIAVQYPDSTLICFGDRPDFEINTSGLNIVDFTECWHQGTTLNQQAAVLSQTRAVVGINSGSIDLPVMAGVPALRLRTHQPPSPYYNDQISSKLTVNVLKYGEEEEQVHSLDKALELFFSEVDRPSDTQSRIYYVGSKKTIYREISGSKDEDSLNIQTVLNGEDPQSRIVDADTSTLDETESYIWQCYRAGSFPIVTSNQPLQLQDKIQRGIFMNGFGWKYLDSINSGIIIHPDETDQTVQYLCQHPNYHKKAIFAGYLKYSLRTEAQAFHDFSENNNI